MNPENYLQVETIKGIEVVIVESHNEVLPYWFNAGNLEPAVVIHIDDHEDMRGGHLTLEALSLSDVPRDLRIYACEHSHMAAFIVSARHYNKVGPIYYINLRREEIMPFGRTRKGLFKDLAQTVEDRGWITWDGSSSPNDSYEEIHRNLLTINFEELFEDLGGYCGPLILDIDLDVFLNNFFLNNSDYIQGLERRFKRFESLLTELPRPKIITIARSLMFTPRDKVDFLQDRVLRILEEKLS